MSSKKIAVYSLVLIFCVILLVQCAFIYKRFFAPRWFEETKIITIQSGHSLKDIADHLYQDKVISSPLFFRIYAYASGKGSKIQAGEFEVKGFVDPSQLITLLTSAKAKNYALTFVEGTTFNDLLKQVLSDPKLDKTLVNVPREHILEKVIEEEIKFIEMMKLSKGVIEEGGEIIINPAFNWRVMTEPEGLFFPDTYYFTAGMRDIDILQKAFHKMILLIEAQWLKRAQSLPYASPYHALIMASIIEKETGLAEERAQIAGVFIRRLNKGMKLQTDPTVIYGVGDKFNGNLTREHLRTPTPFNTYVIEGLPPTPIALIGKAAFVAALHPQLGEAIFFVSRGDGSHYFSKTLSEHERAIKLYQK